MVFSANPFPVPPHINFITFFLRDFAFTNLNSAYSPLSYLTGFVAKVGQAERLILISWPTSHASNDRMFNLQQCETGLKSDSTPPPSYLGVNVLRRAEQEIIEASPRYIRPSDTLL
ncbi:hypothetical protein FOQG_01008 [Fusarium oxysporum f. sp. raphani 54005]|uniref:Uncharacterized protein n=4 Tax=Fusarium oxysporum TaxID=5507 RepID=X0DDN6_FUSOX|nr:hypothetical protein FOVG_02572 [Fusarium oxysporum f. sp. pisi HDV247]EXL01190.1 hypothetical protein FOQG_01008 [Fusarium oxysporum f. sp. raphani 54005]EXL85396.1 hypothetical protein FOPG_02750 [Fusarium oxysporum f. sp. conglutinans race 2 54008]EXM37181.1 hypothetical protein FOTG_00986 [Fusarium oxysporum f. sp. vasinfectum 25433]KAJ4056709.1 hypothetical protein NW763_007466 [Fusarium oxysporum]